MLAIGPLAGLALFIFRFCTGNLMFAVAPLEGWFLAANLTPMGWFPT